MFERAINLELARRLGEPRRFVQIVWGPRQVGKTTSVNQVLERLGMKCVYASADAPTMQTSAWIEAQWNAARALRETSGKPVVLALDEVQKVPDWSSWVKSLWDEDSRTGADVRVVILGSSPLLMQAGMTESLAGRFEVIRATHWTFAECREAFGWDLDTFVYFGGYPGGAPLVGEPDRWRSYIVDSLIETSISRDILLMMRVDKPALLRQLFHLACEYSGQAVSYTKMLGQLTDAGNATTLAGYLRLLEQVGLVAGLQKHAGTALRRRGSVPKLQVLNTGLMSALSPLTFEQAKADRAFWGRLVESAVGAYLMAEVQERGFAVRYWREGGLEVDFVLDFDGDVTAVEVKSGESSRELAGLEAFRRRFSPRSSFVIGADGMPLESFLAGEVPLMR